GSLTLPEGAGLDLGGIAKGAAGDLAEALLEEHGIGSALLTLGGQVICCGTPDDDWRIALRNPDDAAHPLGVLSIAAGSVATSGDYERYFELGGRRYHHILDPVTGWPASVDLRSVTVVSDSAVTADALSTALFIMGHEGAIAHWRQQTDFEMILVGTDGLLTVTAGLEDRFEAVDGAEVLVVRR
ncbi:MAG: FAD:protein FMN transferase, partial [Clostridia bacterium]|nr:FAD:protein FMN transferase [Clostridia bacterium]